MPWPLHGPRRSSVSIEGSWVSPRASLDKFWRTENPLPPPGIEPWTLQSITSCCTNYAISLPMKYWYFHYTFLYKLI